MDNNALPPRTPEHLIRRGDPTSPPNIHEERQSRARVITTPIIVPFLFSYFPISGHANLAGDFNSDSDAFSTDEEEESLIDLVLPGDYLGYSFSEQVTESTNSSLANSFIGSDGSVISNVSVNEFEPDFDDIDPAILQNAILIDNESDDDFGPVIVAQNPPVHFNFDNTEDEIPDAASPGSYKNR